MLILLNFDNAILLHNQNNKKAEIFYKNNYSKTSNDKSNINNNSIISSLKMR